MKESNFDFLDMKQSILDLLVSRSMSQPALDVTPGPAQPVAVEVCLKIKIQRKMSTSVVD